MRFLLLICSASLALTADPIGGETSSERTAQTPAPEVEPPAVSELKDDLRVVLIRWREHEEMLGERRRRRLEVARFHLAREDFGRPLTGDPLAFEETKDILHDCFVKLARERLARTPPIEQLVGRVENLGDALQRPFEGDGSGSDGKGARGLRLSPRLGLGHDPYFGARLRLRAAPEDPRSRFTLGFRQRLERSARSLYLQYEDDDRSVRLEHVHDDEAGGERFAVSVRLRL